MVPLVRLQGSGIETSRLVLGLSRLHYLYSSKERQRLFAAAADLGFRQFDAARIYGDGLAEKELGRFLRGRRDRFIVATKYGLPADPWIEALSPVAQPLRVVRSLGRRVGLWPMQHPPLTAAGLRASIERSLRALRVNCIDILFLHQASLERMPDAPALVAEADLQKCKGTIRFVGVSGDYPSAIEIAQKYPALAQVVQVPEAQWSEALVPDLTFSVMRRDGQTGFESALDPGTALNRLQQALKRRPNGAVVVSTTSVNHLDRLAAIAQETPA